MQTFYNAEMNILSKKYRYLLTAVFFILAVLVIVSYYVDFNAPGFNKPTLPVVVILVIFFILVIAFVMFFKVNIVVSTNEIKFRVFSTRVIKKKDIEKVEMIEFNALKDYGGWGYRMVKGERAFITDGMNKGVRIIVKDGPNLVIACNDSERIYRALSD